MLPRHLLLLALCALLYAVLGASAQSDPRQAPPPGRALPPVPELQDGGTVTAAGPGSQPAEQPGHAEPEPAEAETSAEAPPGTVVRQQSSQLGSLAAPAFRKARQPGARLPQLAVPGSATSEDTASSQAAPSAAASAEPVVPPQRTAKLQPGKHASERAQWRRFDSSPAPLLGPQPQLPPTQFTAALLPQLRLPSAALFEVQSGFLFEPGTLMASTQGVAFIGRPSPAGPPVELVLPQPPPKMPAPSVRTSLTELSRGSSKTKRVALTFDDGPHPEYTSQLLAILDFYDARATFFIVGVQAQKYPHWVKMIQQAGHEVANHTYDHFRLPELPAEEQVYQIDECTRLLEQLTGMTPRFFRPPGGRYSPEVERLLRQRGMVLALWDVGLNDTAEDREAADLLQTAGKSIRPGSVVLAHDGIQATVDMLPALIESLQRDGYQFVTLSELAAGL